MTRFRDLITRTHQVLDAAYDAELDRAKVDLTPQQIVVLEAIWDEDKPSQTAIVNVTHIDRSTMGDVVRRLVKKGLVTRRKARADARRYMLELTPAGKQVTLRAQLIAKNVEDRIAADAGPAMKGIEKRLTAVISAATDGSGLALVAAE